MEAGAQGPKRAVRQSIVSKGLSWDILLPVSLDYSEDNTISDEVNTGVLHCIYQPYMLLGSGGVQITG